MKIVISIVISAVFSIAGWSQGYSPTRSLDAVADIDFSKAKEVDAAYKATFDACDKPGKACAKDPNLLEALLRFGDTAIFFESKMALDLDGSSVACNCHDTIGKYDQCNTSYTWKTVPTAYAKTDRLKRCPYYGAGYFMDSEKIPYIVVPGGFSDKVTVEGARVKYVGDLGIVIYDGKVVPVIVADTGPIPKIGEGSAALLREIGEDRCKPKGATPCKAYLNAGAKKTAMYFIFPNSKISKEILNKDNAVQMIRTEALKKFEELKAKY